MLEAQAAQKIGRYIRETQETAQIDAAGALPGSRISGPLQQQETHTNSRNQPGLSRQETRHHPQLHTSRQNLMAEETHRLRIGYFRQLDDHVMRDDLVASKLRIIRQTIGEYDDFIRGKDIAFSTVEDQRRLSELDEVQPFLSLPDVQKEPYSMFSPQSSSLVVLWRSMFNVRPTARLGNELARLGPALEELKFSPVFRGSIAYLLLHCVFYEPDQLRKAEQDAGLRSLTESMRPSPFHTQF